MTTTLSKKIMTKIYLIYLLRLSLSKVALKMYLIGGLLLSLVQLSSVSNIFINMWSVGNTFGILRFWLSAISHTELSIQIITAVFIITLAFLVLDIIHNFSRVTFLKSKARSY